MEDWRSANLTECEQARQQRPGLPCQEKVGFITKVKVFGGLSGGRVRYYPEYVDWELPV